MDVAQLPDLPPRPRDSHKGTFGRVLALAGSEEMIGAPVMAGTSALRMGAGLVQIAVPRSILSAALSITPELIGLALTDSSAKRLAEASEKAQAIVMGPGLGQSRAARKRVLQVIALDKAMVVDADALNLISRLKSWPVRFKGKAVLTPHPGEMSRLIRFIGKARVPGDDGGRLQIATELAQALGQVVVLKGYRTVITDGARTYVNHTGDSSLAKAGTGDVLTGMIGALLAQKMDRFEAACLAVYLHGRAGELAGEKFGKRCVLAREVICALSDAVLEYEARQPQGWALSGGSTA
ncbi:MAG: NAD(P)H-hydrate dehydratase [Oligoflexia bacterium]|nr:NAD(P)H-hydrate dehydratase [Oligoflexia bacterium]